MRSHNSVMGLIKKVKNNNAKPSQFEYAKETQYRNCVLCIYYKHGRCKNLDGPFFDKPKTVNDLCDKFVRKATVMRLY